MSILMFIPSLDIWLKTRQLPWPSLNRVSSSLASSSGFFDNLTGRLLFAKNGPSKIETMKGGKQN